MELGEIEMVYRSEPVFTPFRGRELDELDEDALAVLLEGWFRASGVHPRELGAGGAIVTGLAARKRNAGTLLRLVRERVPEALVATADDPSLESWVAFMGSCAGLSAARPGTPFLNLDIGGGTTNLALGRAGEVESVGCLLVGARHVRVEPGSYRIAGLSLQATALFRELGIAKGPGDRLAGPEVELLMARYVSLLEAAIDGNREAFREPWAVALETVRFRPPPDVADALLTISGGVGELLYAHAQGRPLPGTTFFGDLGIDLALALARSPRLSRDLRTVVPPNLGRATVYGLALFSTEISGATVHLPRPELLPLRDLPIVARLAAGDLVSDGESRASEALLRAVDRARAGGRGACIQLTSVGAALADVRRLGDALAEALRATAFPDERPLVVFVPGNVGKALGGYASAWGGRATNLIVIDELPDRGAHFAGLGAPRHGVIPVSFFGIGHAGGPPGAQA